MATNFQFLVDTSWLSEHLSDENLVIVDCHWDSNAYIRSHIPGAVMRPGHPYVKSESNGEPEKYLPTEQEFTEMLQELGIDDSSTVICYDEWDNHFATRFWWVLTYYGHEHVKLLDGGWQAWVSDGLPISFTTPTISPIENHFYVKENSKWKADLQEVLDNHIDDNWQILDVRSDEEFNGTDQTNLRAGHVPGALHLEWKQLLDSTRSTKGVNYFKSPEDIATLFNEIGIDRSKTTVVHCQSGVRASFTFFCLNMLGYPNIKLYDGSMSEWANREDTPLEST